MKPDHYCINCTLSGSGQCAQCRELDAKPDYIGEAGDIVGFLVAMAVILLIMWRL